MQQHNRRIMEIQGDERKKQHESIRQLSRTSSVKSKLCKEKNNIERQTQRVTNCVLLSYGLLWMDDHWFHWHLHKILIPLFAAGLLYFGIHIETFKNNRLLIGYGLVSCFIFCLSALFLQFERENGPWVYFLIGKVFVFWSNILIFFWYLLKL